MAKSKKNKNKAKLNLTVREEQRNKLEQMASLEKRFRPGGPLLRYPIKTPHPGRIRITSAVWFFTVFKTHR
jgi:hypothetical protein